MKMFRYRLARFAGNFTALLLKLIKRRIPYYPGYIALKVCPNFLDYVKRPKVVIGVTGTNGKSTVCGILNDFFKSQGLQVLNNKGFNIKTGIVTMFLKQKGQADIALIEVDEKLSGEVFKSIEPDYYICTNLFRDSMKTNSTIDYIYQKIKEGIPAKTKMVLNADDLLVSTLGEERDHIYYGIKEKIPNHNTKLIFNDMIYCPKCGNKLEYKDTKYFHIGNVSCPECGFANPKRDYEAKVDYKTNELIIKYNKKTSSFPLKVTSIFNIYNYLAAISLILELGYDETKVIEFLKDMKLIESRYSIEKFGKYTLINHMSKGQNPVACSSVFEFAAYDEGKKCILLMLDDVMDRRDSSETISWYYDTNFELFTNDSIKQIIIGGTRSKDVYVRMLFAGVNPNIISVVEKEEDMASLIDFKEIDKIFILHDITLYDHSCMVADLVRKMGEKYED